MELSAAQGPGAADASEMIVSRPYLCWDRYYVCIFCSLLPDYFVGWEADMLGNLVRNGEQYCFPLGPGFQFSWLWKKGISFPNLHL